MKWIVGVLVLVNAGLFLWATGHKPSTTEFIRPTVNGETMMLLREMLPAQPTVVITPVEDTRKPEGDKLESGERPAEEQQQAALEQTPAICLRIGPFYDDKLAEKTGNRLKAMSLVVSSRTVKAREIRAYRVFLGPFESPSEIDKQRKELTDKGISDHYIKRETGQEDIISLGLFIQKTGAKSLVDQLKKKKVSARTKPEDRVMDSTTWLELKDTDADRNVQTELAAIKTWGDARARLSEYPCS
jgi:cell division protein FtsN